MENIKYIDIESGLTRLRGNRALYIKLLKLYLESVEFGQFEAQIAAQDMENALSTIHSIKGFTGNLALTHLYGMSARLNEQLKKGAINDDDLFEYRQIVDKTRAAVIEFIREEEGLF